MTAKAKNTEASPMTYEVQRRPRARQVLQTAAREGTDAVLPEATVEKTTIVEPKSKK